MSELDLDFLAEMANFSAAEAALRFAACSTVAVATVASEEFFAVSL